LAESNPPERLAVEEELLPPNYTWNARAFALDVSMFTVGVSFVSSTTVLPSLIAKLTDSAMIVGLAGALTSGAWLLPQLVIASAITRLPRKSPLVVRTAWISRPIFLLIALAIGLLGQRHPTAALGAVLAGITIFFFFDAIVSVPWFDLLGKTIPARRRGRVLGLSEILGGLGGIGAGLAVRFILSDGSPWGFPTNYALLFAAASVSFLLSAVGLTLIREPQSPAQGEQMPSMRETLALLPRILAHDRPFLRLVIIRVLAGFATLAGSFYILYATKALNFSPEATGAFLSAQVVGSLTTGLLMSTLQDRLGPLVHLRAMLAMMVMPPLIALGMEPLHRLWGNGVFYPYLLIYFFLGLSTSSVGWPYFNWLLEYSEEGRRPLYIGLLNTLGAITMLAPTLGGWIVSAISYPAAFASGVAFALIGLMVTLTLPSTRRKRKAVAH